MSSFAKHFGKDFQEKIMHALLLDPKWAEQMIEIIRPQHFELTHLQFLSTKYFSYYDKYKVFPSSKMLFSEAQQDLKTHPDENILNNVQAFYKKKKKNPELNDLPGVRDRTRDFCKKQALQEALDISLDLVKADRYGEVIPVMKKAMMAGEESSLGHDFKKDREARWVKDLRQCCPTGLDALDHKFILDGGVGKGELAVFAASKGVGKSHWLVSVGAAALSAGLNVLHYTFELNAFMVGLRYDSWICEINSKQIVENKEEVVSLYEKLDDTLGELKIKKYPIRSITCNAIRAHLQKLLLKEGFKPDIIIIDYADNMRSSENYDASQNRFELKRIYEDLKNLAEEQDCPVWTASQLNKEASNDDIATIGGMAEAFGKSDDPDIIITLTMNLKKKSLGYATMYVAKSRAGEDGQVLHIHIDRSQSRFSVVNPDDVPESIDDAENQAMDNARKVQRNLRNKQNKKANEDLKVIESLGGEKLKAPKLKKLVH